MGARVGFEARSSGVGWLIRVFGMAAVALGGAALMSLNYARDPYNPALLETRAYGHNHEGALAEGLLFMALELAVVYAVLRPWSYQRSWGRAAVLLIVLAPWTALSMVSCMHAGGVVVIHLLWVLVLDTILATAILWRAASALFARRGFRPREHPGP